MLYFHYNIVTIEDPIEFIFHANKSCIIQREVGIDTESFDKALKAAMRMDPDVIMVGEMRDLETIDACIKAAETGHLVLTAIHTPGHTSDSICLLIDNKLLSGDTLLSENVDEQIYKTVMLKTCTPAYFVK
jgi:twitching motility protein PilT